ncbi:MAG: SCP2 sterol-binding domain-containing protein [Candidatus Odinarchaeota archaeon]
MLNSKAFNSVLKDLENHDGEFISLLDKIIKFAVNKFSITEDLREEIVGYNDIYQIIVKDIDFNFWLKVSNSSIIYKKGINRNASFRVKYTKDLLVKILKREMNGTDAYMRGIIKVDGDLSQGLRFIKLFRIFLEYLNNGLKNHN